MPLPLMWGSLAFIGGIVLASAANVSVYVWLGLALIAVIGALMAWRFLRHLPAVSVVGRALHLPQSALALVLPCLAAASLGAARYQAVADAISSSSLAFFNDGGYDLLVTGTLIEPPDVRDTYTNLRLLAQSVDTGLDQVNVNGLLLARVEPNQQFHYGDILRLRGRLETPPSNEDFSYREYLARQGIRSYMGSAEATLLPGKGGSPLLAATYSLRDLSLKKVYSLFLDPEASLLAGILLGIDSGIPARVEQAFNDTGTAHIIAISGFNIAIIAGVLAFFFNRVLGARRGAIAAFLGIVFYTVFVGADPAVVRAAMMGAVTLLAVQVGRRQVGLNTLAMVAALMALASPLVLWDVGFQLSLFATLGLILYGTPFMDAAARFMSRRLPASEAQKIASALGQFLLLTLAAQLTTLPIIAYHFRQVSLVAPLANAFILPAQPLVMMLGGLAILLSFVLFPLAQLVAWLAWPLTAYTVRMVEFFDGLSHTVVYLGGFSLLLVVLFYVALFAITFAGNRLRQLYSDLQGRFGYVPTSTALVVLLLIGALFVWRLVGVAPDGNLHLTFVDVGSADAVLIQTPSGRHVLINGGPSAASASDALGRRLSPLDHSLDWLVLASTDEEQVAALPRLLQRYPAGDVLLGARPQASFSAGALMQALADEGVPVTDAEEGQALDLGGGARLRIFALSPRGATVLVEWNSFRALLPIGANLETLARLMDPDEISHVNVLLLSQSGYAPLTPQALIQNLNPQLVVIGVAAGDRNGLPDKATLDALEGYSVLRTDLNGAIDVMTDGSQMWVSTERTSSETATPTLQGSAQP